MNSGLTKNKRSIFFCHLQVRIPIAGMTLFHFRDFTDQGSIREEETLAVFIKGCIREIRYWIILERAGKQKSRRVLRDDKIYLWPTNLRSQACWVAKMVLQRNSSWGGLWKIPFLCVTFSVGPLPSFFWKARSCCWLTGSASGKVWTQSRGELGLEPTGTSASACHSVWPWCPSENNGFCLSAILQMSCKFFFWKTLSQKLPENVTLGN